MLLFIVAAIIYISIVILIAQRKAPSEYNYKENTISELACQAYDDRNIMQWGFKGFGIIILAGLLINWKTAANEPHYTVPLLIYSLGILLSGFFSTKPFEHLVFYSIKESKIHSICAQISGFSLSLLVVMKFILVPGYLNRILNIFTLIFILYNSAQTGRSHEYRGIYQRVMYTGCFLWLIYAYSGMMN